MLQTGALPVDFMQLERTDVSATLGKDSLDAGEEGGDRSACSLVALFLLLFYRFLGLVAVIGLAIYAAFLYAAILLFNVTLTLPGFAGLILTIGVAADANVVIFERIKEEVRAGQVRARRDLGRLRKGFHTIVDANVVTAITALVLFAVATAQRQGLRPDAADRHRDLAAHRGRRHARDARPARRLPAGSTTRASWAPRAQQGAKWLQIDFIGSAAALVRDLGRGRRRSRSCSLAVKGLNLGIDFKGGTQIAFKTAAADVARRRPRPEPTIGQSDAVVQGRGAGDGRRSYKSFQIRTEVARPRQTRNSSRDSSERAFSADVARRQERLVELRPPDRAGRDPRDHRLAAPDRRSTSRSGSTASSRCR